MESEALEFICGHRDNPFYRKNEPANNSQPRACLSLAESPPPPPLFKLNRVFFIEKCVCFSSDSILVPFFFFPFLTLRFKVLIWWRLGLLPSSSKDMEARSLLSSTAFACPQVHICIFASLCFLESVFHTC